MSQFCTHTVLARKWRPSQFADVVGQQHIIKTLNNAILMQRIAQAYLFTGSRGIGKTSIARIFSKAIRCKNVQKIPQYTENSLIESCDDCQDCKEIALGHSVNVIEIDGASNNGVDAVREIRENAQYMPTTGSKKIYIIDEVHMLTTAAFNALLKTLEEPPTHIIFILATTEPHKIPATILSRCQKFDCKRITHQQIQSRLMHIFHSDSELKGIQADTEALSLIARTSDGSLRDALSVIDQIIAFSGNHISLQTVTECLGLIETQTSISILKAIFERQPIKALTTIHSIFEKGQDLKCLIKNLIEITHGIILLKIGATPSTTLTHFSDDDLKILKDMLSIRTLEEIELIFQVLHQGVEWIARSSQPKEILDVLVIKCAAAENLTEISKIQPGFSEKNATATPSDTGKDQFNLDLNKREVPYCAKPLACVEAHQFEARKFVEFAQGKQPLLASILTHAAIKLESSNKNQPQILYINFSTEETYFREQVQSKAILQQLELLLKEYLNIPLVIQVGIHKEKEYRETIKHDSIILEAQSLLGGEIGPTYTSTET